MKDYLFKSIEDDICLNLLFLKNVQEIKMTVISPTGAVTEVVGASKQVEAKDDELKMVTIVDTLAGKELQSFYSYGLTLDESSEFIHDKDKRAVLELASKLKVLPSITVAGCIPRDKSETIPDNYHGRMSVLLPLPATNATKTGLPVIVNGFFALSENRRVVKFEADDDHSDEVVPFVYHFLTISPFFLS